MGFRVLLGTLYLDYREDYVVVHSDVHLFPMKLFLCLCLSCLYVFLHTYVTYESKTIGLFVCFLQVVKENFFSNVITRIVSNEDDEDSIVSNGALYANFCVRFCIDISSRYLSLD